MSKIVRLSDYRRRAKRESRPVYFTRQELNLLLSLYSHRVIGGEWKDYAIDQGKGLSAFSVFGDCGDRPIFTVFKFAGSTICYAFMQAVGMVNDHVNGCRLAAG